MNHVLLAKLKNNFVHVLNRNRCLFSEKSKMSLLISQYNVERICWLSKAVFPCVEIKERRIS